MISRLHSGMEGGIEWGTDGPLQLQLATAVACCETVPETGEVARFPAETLGTHKDGQLHAGCPSCSCCQLHAVLHSTAACNDTTFSYQSINVAPQYYHPNAAPSIDAGLQAQSEVMAACHAPGSVKSTAKSISKTFKLAAGGGTPVAF
jgi:hypothetical protein